MSGFLHFCMLGFLCFIVTYLWSLPCFILSLLSLQAYFPRSVSSSTTAYGMYVCMYCSANEKEDEAHFLIKCDKLNNKREELFKLISSKVKNFTKLSNNQKLYYILTCEGQEILFKSKNRNNLIFICMKFFWIRVKKTYPPLYGRALKQSKKNPCKSSFTLT
jgi:hypothetical protein